MFNCSERIHYSTKDKLNDTYISDSTSSFSTDCSSRCENSNSHKYIVELKEVFKCTLCDAILVGNISLNKHLKRFNHKTRRKMQEESEENSSGIHSCSATLNDSFLHSSPKSSEEDSRPCDNIKESVDYVSQSIDHPCTTFKNSNFPDSREQPLNSTSSSENNFDSSGQVDFSTSFSEYSSKSQDALTESLKSDEPNEKIESKSAPSDSLSFQSEALPLTDDTSSSPTEELNICEPVKLPSLDDECTKDIDVCFGLPTIEELPEENFEAEITNEPEPKSPACNDKVVEEVVAENVTTDLTTAQKELSNECLDIAACNKPESTFAEPFSETVLTCEECKVNFCSCNDQTVPVKYTIPEISSHVEEGASNKICFVQKSEQCTLSVEKEFVQTVTCNNCQSIPVKCPSSSNEICFIQNPEQIAPCEPLSAEQELIQTFICSNCQFKFPSKDELLEHVEIENCMNNVESCESEIDVENIKNLVKFNVESKVKSKSRKASSSKLFPQPQNKENYINRFLRNGPENILMVNTEHLLNLQKSLEYCYVTEKDVYCMLCNETCLNDPQMYYEHFRSEKHSTFSNNISNDQTVDDRKYNLNLAKNYLIQISRNGLKCVCCKMNFGYYNNKITAHIRSRTHRLITSISHNRVKILYEKIEDSWKDVWYNIERYWCEPCNLKFFHEIHFSNHLETWNHKQNVANKMLIFDICIPCSSLWLGLPNTYDIHSQILVHKYMLEHKVYEGHPMANTVVSLIKNFSSNMHFLIQEADNAIAKFTSSKAELIKSIEELLKPHFPEIRVQIFGSKVTGVCCSKGAVDINLTFGYTNIISANCFFAEVQNYFIEKADEWEMECVMIRENIPILHLFHIKTKLKCNIAIGDELSVEKTQITKSFIEMYPLCKEMIIFLKRWFFLCQLWSSKGISTFTIVWLVIFFLQIKINLPSIYNLIQKRHMANYTYEFNNEKLLNLTAVIKKIDTSEDIKRHINLEHLNVRRLLIEWFKFYAYFNYKEHVICPVLGNSVKKEVFITDNNVPREMTFNHFSEDLSNSFHIESPFCLQDPLEYKQNITKNISKLTLREFKHYCAKSAKLLAYEVN